MALKVTEGQQQWHSSTDHISLHVCSNCVYVARLPVY